MQPTKTDVNQRYADEQLGANVSDVSQAHYISIKHSGHAEKVEKC